MSATPYSGRRFVEPVQLSHSKRCLSGSKWNAWNREKSFLLSDLCFLMDTGHTQDAARWCYAVRDQIDGHAYWILPEVAKRFSDSGEALAATVIWRALLDDLLESGRSRAYGHGARYLKRLRAISTINDDWKDFAEHAAYEHRLAGQHGRKSSFWRRVDSAVG